MPTLTPISDEQMFRTMMDLFSDASLPNVREKAAHVLEILDKNGMPANDSDFYTFTAYSADDLLLRVHTRLIAMMLHDWPSNSIHDEITKMMASIHAQKGDGTTWPKTFILS